MNKEYTWDLEILYKGYKDPKYKEDLKKLKDLIKDINKNFNKQENEIKYIERYLTYSEKITELANELYMYGGLRLSTNANDNEAQTALAKIDIMMQDLVEVEVEFKKFLKDLDIDKLAKSSKLINSYAFNLKNKQEEASHMLSSKEEVLASKLEMVSSDAWSDLQQKLTSNLTIKVKGMKGRLPLSAVRNLAYDKDPVVRKNAYTAELKAYKLIDESVAMALNNIKREVNITNELRGYKDGLDKTLKQSSMSEASLNALIDAIKEEAPNFRKYFKLKAKALGYEGGLPFYELFAPMGHLTKTYTYEEAKELVLDVYKSFSDDLYKLGSDAFNNRWIDVLPYPGKEGGAFCAGLDNHDQSRVLTNFTGSLGDVQTLAHELGHAYHGRV